MIMLRKYIMKALGLKDAEPARKKPDSEKPVRSGNTRARGEYRYSGKETQFKGAAEAERRAQLVCGLDFGTAFTKCVVGDSSRNISYAIPWIATTRVKKQYLQPSALWIKDNGDCLLDAASENRIDDMKMRLLAGERSEELRNQMCVFMALAFQRARRFILKEKHAVYKKHKLDWMLNIGVPTANYHDDELVDFYKSIANNAWNISQENKAVNIQTIEKRLAAPNKVGADDIERLHPDAIHVFPEFVAQVTGYVRSSLRQSGLHLLIDVGAGTLDATTFNVFQKDGENRFPIFAGSVERLGARFLVKNRIKNTAIEEAGELDPFSLIPSKEKFSILLEKDAAEIDKLDMPFRQAIFRQVNDLLRYTKEKRSPLAFAWRTGVPMLFCGGGSHCDFYQELLSKRDRVGRYRIQPRDMPKPDQLEAPGLSIADCDRVSVAHGLSFHAFDIGEIVREGEIENISDNANQPEHNAMCPDCLGSGLFGNCPKCGGRGFI